MKLYECDNGLINLAHISSISKAWDTALNFYEAGAEEIKYTKTFANTEARDRAYAELKKHFAWWENN